jgi:hypothetical protein
MIPLQQGFGKMRAKGSRSAGYQDPSFRFPEQWIRFPFESGTAHLALINSAQPQIYPLPRP